jgi:hypothetical protein
VIMICMPDATYELRLKTFKTSKYHVLSLKPYLRWLGKYGQCETRLPYHLASLRDLTTSCTRDISKLK